MGSSCCKALVDALAVVLQRLVDTLGIFEPTTAEGDFDKQMRLSKLVWEYADGSVTRMNRLCQLPSQFKTPVSRGPRFSLDWN